MCKPLVGNFAETAEPLKESLLSYEMMRPTRPERYKEISNIDIQLIRFRVRSHDSNDELAPSS